MKIRLQLVIIEVLRIIEANNSLAKTKIVGAVVVCSSFSRFAKWQISSPWIIIVNLNLFLCCCFGEKNVFTYDANINNCKEI